MCYPARSSPESRRRATRHAREREACIRARTPIGRGTGSSNPASSSGESVANPNWAKAAVPMRLPSRLLGLYLLEDMSALPLRIGPRRYGRTTAEVSEESSRRSRGHVAERVLGFRWSSSPRQQGRAGISGGSSALLQGDQRSNPLSSSSDSARWVSGPASPYRLPTNSLVQQESALLPASVEGVRSILESIHLVVLNRVREHRSTPAIEIEAILHVSTFR